MSLVMVHVQIRPENMGEFNEAMAVMKPYLQRAGWKLVGAYGTRFGHLGECWDIWEVPSVEGMGDDLLTARKDPTYMAAAARSMALVENEDYLVIQELPYGHYIVAVLRTGARRDRVSRPGSSVFV